MKISNSTPNYISQSYINQKPDGNLKSPAKPESPDTSVTDTINLSDKTKDIQKISTAMETEPADREQYVADIKQKVESNQYNVNAEAVAEKMAGGLMDEIG